MSVELIGGVCNDLKKMLTMLNGNTHNNISKTDHGNDDKHRKTIIFIFICAFTSTIAT